MRRFLSLVAFSLIGAMPLLAEAQTATASAPAAPPSAEKKISPGKEQAIRELMAITGMEKLLDQMVGQMMSGFQQELPTVPGEVWTRMAKKMNGAEVIELLIPLYDRYYTEDDLRQVIAFYKTPVGQKLMKTLPAITQEAMQIGQEWGRAKAEEVMNELRAEKLLPEQP